MCDTGHALQDDAACGLPEVPALPVMTRGPTFADLLSPQAIQWLAACTVADVSGFLRHCSLMQTADAVDDNSVDGKTFLDLTQDDLLASVGDGGLGLKRLQLRRLQTELQGMHTRSSATWSLGARLTLALLPWARARAHGCAYTCACIRVYKRIVSTCVSMQSARTHTRKHACEHTHARAHAHTRGRA